MKPLPPIPSLPSSVAQGRGSYNKIVLLVGGASAPTSAFKIPKAMDEAAPLNPKPSTFDGARSRLKPLLPKHIVLLVGGAFAPNSAFKIPRATDEAASPNPKPSVFGGARSRLKPLLQQNHPFCRRGFSPELLSSRSQGPRMKAAPHDPEPSAFNNTRITAEDVSIGGHHPPSTIAIPTSAPRKPHSRCYKDIRKDPPQALAEPGSPQCSAQSSPRALPHEARDHRKQIARKDLTVPEVCSAPSPCGPSISAPHR